MVNIKDNKIEKDKNNQKTDANSICLGAITSAHGLRGQVKVKFFGDDPMSLVHYDHIYTDEKLSGDPIKILKIKDTQKGDYIITIEGVKDRNQAESLRGKDLYINRDDLPEIEDEEEFYYDDLVGCRAVLDDEKNSEYGHVKAIFNFGSDDLIEIAKDKGDQSLKDKSIILSFSKENVPVVDIKNKKITLSKDAVLATEEMDNSKAGTKDKKAKKEE